jgi:hypothetical protein
MAVGLVSRSSPSITLNSYSWVCAIAVGISEKIIKNVNIMLKANTGIIFFEYDTAQPPINEEFNVSY